MKITKLVQNKRSVRLLLDLQGENPDNLTIGDITDINALLGDEELYEKTFYGSDVLAEGWYAAAQQILIIRWPGSTIGFEVYLEFQYSKEDGCEVVTEMIVRPNYEGGARTTSTC